MTKRAHITAILALCANSALAKNTNEDWKWVNTYYATYGEWTTACENRADDDRIKRCYLRYVDAYASDPFGALFVFATVTQQGLSFSFEFEYGTDFTKTWNVTTGGKEIWSFDADDCPFFGDCIIDGDKAATLAKALASPAARLNFSFIDNQNRRFERSWRGDQQFADALHDLQMQTEERGLL